MPKCRHEKICSGCHFTIMLCHEGSTHKMRMGTDQIGCELYRRYERVDVVKNTKNLTDVTICPKCNQKQKEKKEEWDDCENKDCGSYVFMWRGELHWWHGDWNYEESNEKEVLDG